MGKYKNANVLQKEILQEQNQQHLKEKHNIQDEDVVVVEKTQIFKWLSILIRSILSIAVFVAAAIGIFTLLYPDMRNEFISILNQILTQIGG